MKKYKDLRKMYKDAGVNIHIAKFSPENWSDEEIEYSFNAAKALGAKGVCNEIGDNACKRMGPIAQKHGMYAIFHQHLQPGEPGWNFDKFLEYSPANMLNFDAGHYFGATGLHPNGIIERLHNRIVSVHLKDKTGPKGIPPNTNMPWGKGETPITDILLLIKKNKWPIYVDIELEYPVPAGSDAVAEVKKCVEFCRNILA
jgi:sugar phosphate isomerase/epimerase